MADTTINLNVLSSGNAAQQMTGLAGAARQAGAAHHQVAQAQAGAANASTGLAKAQAQQAQGAGAAAQQMTGLARATDDAAKATQRLTQAQAEGIARNRIAQQENEKLVSKEVGRQQGQRFGGLAGVASKAIAGVMVVQGLQHVMGGAANMINASKDPTLSPERRADTIRENIPIIGGILKSFHELRDAVNGTTVKLKLLDQSYDAHKKAQVVIGSFQSSALGVQNERAGLEARQYAFAKYKGPEAAGVRLGAFDRTTVQGDRLAQQAERRLPLEQQARTAGLEKVAAEGHAGEARMEVERRERTVNQAEQLYRVAQNRAKNATGKVGGKEAVQKEDLALDKLEKERNLLIQARQQLRQAETTALQAQSGVNKAIIALDRERLAVLGEQEQRIRGQAQSFGALTAVEKIAAVNSLERLKKQGVAALSGEERALLQRAGAGEHVNKALENNALDDPRFKQFQGLLGEKADLRKVQAERIKLQNEIGIKVEFDEKQFADQMEKVVGRVLGKIEQTMRDSFVKRIEQIEVQQKVRNRAQG